MRALLIWAAVVSVGVWVAGVSGADVDVVSKVRGGHPRIILEEGTVERIKGAVASDAWLKGRYEGQVRAADRMLKEKVSAYVKPDGIRLLATSRAVLERVSTLALVYRVSGDKKYLERCWGELEAASKFRDWNPSHFLDVAEMTAAFSIGYDWLYADWSAEQRGVLRGAIVSKGLVPAVNVYDHRYNWWPSEVHNWNVVCNGGVSMGALAVAGEVGDAETEKAVVGRVLSEAVRSVPKCLEQFEPDGAWPEGPSYWGYTTLFESMYLDALRTACGEEFGLLGGEVRGQRSEVGEEGGHFKSESSNLKGEPGVSRGAPGSDTGISRGIVEAGWFPVYLSGATGHSFNFADAHESSRPEGGCQLLWMARRFGEPRYAGYQAEVNTGRVSALDVVWGAEAGARAEWRTIPTDRYFRRVEVATMRDNWTDPDAWFVGFKAGSNAVNHSHLDVGSYVMEAKGVRWVVDLGSEDYNLPGYWDKKGGGRWQYYRLRAEGHNTIVVNPGKGPDQRPGGEGKVTKFEAGGKSVVVEADLTGAYEGVERVVRKVEFVRGESVTVSDEVKLKGPGEVWSFFQTRAKVGVGGDGKEVTLSQDGKTVKVVLIGEGKFEAGAAGPLPTSPKPAKQSGDPGVTRVGVHLTGVSEARVGYRIEG